MSVTSHADVIVLNRRPGPTLLPGDLVLERRPVRAPGPGEVVVRNVVTSVGFRPRLALYRQAGRPDLGGVGRAVTPARAV